MDIKNNIEKIEEYLSQYSAGLVAVSKTKPVSLIEEAYQSGQRIFGENKAQEMSEKYDSLPKDIQWHMIGHLQRNKVKYIAPFVSLIHSVDSPRLLREIDKQAKKNGRTIDCLLQVHIADEETKFGLSEEEVLNLIRSTDFADLKNIKIVGLMGMATNTDDNDQIKNEFKSLKQLFYNISQSANIENVHMRELSMGMSGDYKIALEEGSTLVRVGSAIFGARDYDQ